MEGVDQGQREMVCAGRGPSRLIAAQPNSPDVRLGVKWSQVQILSARPRQVVAGEMIPAWSGSESRCLQLKPDERQYDPCRLSGRHLVTMAEL
jgi:hypothetical protein